MMTTQLPPRRMTTQWGIALPRVTLPRVTLPRVALVCAALLCAALAGCTSSAPTHYHSLEPAARPAPVADNASYAVEMLTVTVPKEEDQPSIVVRGAGSGVDILDQEQWAAPLGDEVRQALSDELGRKLGTLVYFEAPHESKPTYRIGVDIRRFDLVQNQYSILEAVWYVENGPGTENTGTIATPACQTVLSNPAAAGLANLIASQQLALNALADQIADAVKRKAQGLPPSCPADPAPLSGG